MANFSLEVAGKMPRSSLDVKMNVKFELSAFKYQTIDMHDVFLSFGKISSASVTP